MAQPYPLPREIRETDVLVGDGGTEYGPFGFKIFDTADVEVWLKADGEEIYSVAAVTVAKEDPAAAFDTFTVTFGAAITAADSFVVRARRLHERSLAVTRGGGISGIELEKELSKQGTVLQELRRDGDRNLRFGPGFSGDAQLPLLGDAQTFVWDEAEERFIPGPTTAEIEAAQGNAAAAAASATAAAGSATAAAGSATAAAGSAVAAAASAAAAADDAGRFITSETEPATREDASPLQAGDFWFKPSTGAVSQWNGTAFVNILSGQASLTLTTDTGDGGTDYTLDASAQAGNTILVIGGLVQTSGFTLVDGVLTVTGGVPAGIPILGMVIETSQLGATTATLTSLADAGGHFTSTNVEGALQEIGPYMPALISAPVEPAGEGDGEANDTAALQAALDSGAAEIRIPSGAEYSCNALTIPSTVRRIFGYGTILQRATGQNLLNGTSLSRLAISVNLRGAAELNSTYASSNDAIRLIDCDDVFVEDMQITRFLHRPVWGQDCKRLTVRNIHFYEGAVGPRFVGCEVLRILDNHLEDVCILPELFTTGIGLESTDGWGGSPVCSDVLIRGNRTEGILNAQGMLIHGGIEVRILENVTKDAIIPLGINPYNTVDYVYYIKVIGNHLEGFAGTWVYGTEGNSGLVMQAGPASGGGDTPVITSAIIANNTIVGGNRYGLFANQGGMQIGYTRDLQCYGNIIQGAGSAGINLYECLRCNVHGNNINTVFEGADSQQYGIYARGSSTGAIRGNELTSTGTSVDITGSAGMSTSDNTVL